MMNKQHDQMVAKLAVYLLSEERKDRQKRPWNKLCKLWQFVLWPCLAVLPHSLPLLYMQITHRWGDSHRFPWSWYSLFLRDVTAALKLCLCRYEAGMFQAPVSIVAIDFGRYKAEIYEPLKGEVMKIMFSSFEQLTQLSLSASLTCFYVRCALNGQLITLTTFCLFIDLRVVYPYKNLSQFSSQIQTTLSFNCSCIFHQYLRKHFLLVLLNFLMQLYR
jgi:hypothetical protein